jgi:hypothetical protein
VQFWVVGRRGHRFHYGFDGVAWSSNRKQVAGYACVSTHTIRLSRMYASKSS